jgi:hypothetical protein
VVGGWAMRDRVRSGKRERCGTYGDISRESLMITTTRTNAVTLNRARSDSSVCVGCGTRTFGAGEEEYRRPSHRPELAPQARERRLAAAARGHVIQIDQHSGHPLSAGLDAFAPRARRHVKGVKVGEVELTGLVARDLRRLLRSTHG